MTEIEQAYNQGLADAANVARAVAAAMKTGDGLNSEGLMLMAEETERRLRIVEPDPDPGRKWLWTGEVTA